MNINLNILNDKYTIPFEGEKHLGTIAVKDRITPKSE